LQLAKDYTSDKLVDCCIEDLENCVWCDKVGGRTNHLGHCTDFYENVPIKERSYSKKKRLNKHERDEKYKRHLKWLDENLHGYPCPAYIVDEKWVKDEGYVKLRKPYYKRQYCGNRYYKKYASKQVRRYEDVIPNGCAYKKVFDYKWTIW
jgi:hypothetical protein